MRFVVALSAALAIALGTAACDSGEDRPAALKGAASALPGWLCSPITYEGPGRPQALIVANTALQGWARSHASRTRRPSS